MQRAAVRVALFAFPIERRGFVLRCAVSIGTIAEVDTDFDLAASGFCNFLLPVIDDGNKIFFHLPFALRGVADAGKRVGIVIILFL